MIQRQQTLWLLAALIALVLTFRFPVYSGNVNEDNITTFRELTAASGLFLLLATGLAALITLVSIFVFKNRKTQFRLVWLAILLVITAGWFYYSQIKEYATGNFTLTAVLPMLALLFLFLASGGIRRDQRLIRSLDKLR